MEGKLFFRMALILLCCCAASQATSKTFTSDGTIQTGETWTAASIYDTPPNHTTVTMTGGSVTDNLNVYDSSTFNMSGGNVAGLSANNSSYVSVSGGSVITLHLYGNATAMLSGNGSIWGVVAEGPTIFSMISGTINHLGAGQSGTLNLKGGTISDSLNITDPSGIVNVFGYGLFKSDTGGAYGNGLISGYWENGTQFSISLYGSDGFSSINLVPEPSTLFLFGISSLLLRKSR